MKTTTVIRDPPSLFRLSDVSVKGAFTNIDFSLCEQIVFVRNHVKLEICMFVMNFNSGEFSLGVLYCVLDTGYELGRSLGDCRPALPEGQKYQTVKTQTESHIRRPIV